MRPPKTRTAPAILSATGAVCFIFPPEIDWLEPETSSIRETSRFFEAGIWKLPSNGGAETIVVAGRPQMGFWGHYAVADSGLYFLDNDADPHPTIKFYKFATSKVWPVLTLDEKAARLQPSLSATANGKTVYFTQYDRESVIKMMEFAP